MEKGKGRGRVGWRKEGRKGWRKEVKEGRKEAKEGG